MEQWVPVAFNACVLAAKALPMARQLVKEGVSGYYMPFLETIITDSTTSTIKTASDRSLLEDNYYVYIKAADAPLGVLGHLSGWRANPVTNALGGPNTLTAALGTGILGAGLGYGSGWVAEKLAPKGSLQEGKLRKILGLVGGAAGAAPALWAGSRGWFDQPTIKTAYEYVEELVPEASIFEKIGVFRDFDPVIPADRFNEAVWQDDNTPDNLRAATSGLIEGASYIRGSNFVSPMDVAKIATGAGAGYLSGLVVGKTLGALAGLSDSAQKSLQRTGTWAGIISSTVPIVFR